MQAPTETFERARALLRDTFGFPAFRPGQEQVIDHLLAGGSALLVMPTGGGKSLCYQVPALIRDGLGVVVSPLIALMQDQVDSLRELGVRAAFLNSSQSPDEQRAVLGAIRRGEVHLLYVAPERAVTDRFLAALDGIPLSLLAIDEAHCISQWGHEFRPEYRELSRLREQWPDVPTLATTATADDPTRQDVAGQLGIAPGDIVITGFDRPELRYEVVTKVDARAQLLAFLDARHRDHAGIVYCGTRKRCEQVAGWLTSAGFDAEPYHAGMDNDDRARIQRRFLREDGVIVVATIAFGMGIDKPDVRFVAHLDVPKSLEAYYQESGRAGRDGEPSDCWLAFGWQDVVRVAQMIGEVTDETRHRQVERRKLERLVGWCESAGCRREGLLRYFGETGDVACGNCDNCLDTPETWEATIEAQKLLSCVWRTGERFGVVHVIEVLLGKTGDKVTRFGHHRLSTFGIGTEHDALGWRSVARQLVAAGLLEVDIESFGALRLTPVSRDVLSGRREVHLKRDRAAETRRARRGAGAQPGAGARPGAGPRRRVPTVDDDAPYDDALFEKLRALRGELAREQDVPAYVIFHDRTLREMARHRPASHESLATIHGVGGAKLERYGDRFLECLREAGDPAALAAHDGDTPADPATTSAEFDHGSPATAPDRAGPADRPSGPD